MIYARKLRVEREQGFRLSVDEVSIVAGGLVAIVGPNGSGKSTLCSALSGVEKATCEQLSFHGQPVAGLSALSLAQKRAVLSQSTPVSADFEVSEVIQMGAHPHSQLGRSVIEKQRKRVVGLLELDALYRRRLSSLSGGQQQRVHIARCLLQGLLADKPLILLDEPVAALDVAWQHKLMTRLVEIAKSATVIVVLHELNLALQYAREVYVLKNGDIIAAGAPADVLTEACLTAVYGWPFSVLTEPQPLIYSLPQTQKRCK